MVPPLPSSRELREMEKVFADGMKEESRENRPVEPTGTEKEPVKQECPQHRLGDVDQKLPVGHPMLRVFVSQSSPTPTESKEIQPLLQ